jgi:hypothetical protein
LIGYRGALGKPPYRRGEKAGLAGDGEGPEENSRLGSIVEDAFEDGDDGEFGKREGPDEHAVNDSVPFDSLLKICGTKSIFSSS